MKTRNSRASVIHPTITETEAFLPLLAKESGAYFTPDAVVRSLVEWAVHSKRDRLLDPSCGSGHFLAAHANSIGIEQNARSAAEAIRRAPQCGVNAE